MASGDAGMHEEHKNCPSGVEGATTTIKDVEGGVEVSVTAKDEAGGKEVRARMAKLAESAKTAQSDAGAAAKHDHSGGGHGRYGHCTIVMKGTKLETSDVPNGVKAKVTALDKTEVDWLRRETRDRDKESKQPGGEGTGSHKMAHCPAAVEGAKTTVKDTKEGVIVTVTGAADKVAEIRTRAKAIADVAKKPDPAKVEHTGTGTGGGQLGKCPIDPEGDDTVDIKEIDGGIEATIKTKKDVAALQKEVHLRAGGFGAK